MDHYSSDRYNYQRSQNHYDNRNSRGPPFDQSNQYQTKLTLCPEQDNWENGTDVILDSYNCDLNVIINESGDQAKSYNNGGFSMMWGGVRANYGVSSGAVFYEVTVLQNLPVETTEDAVGGADNVIRIGWSTDSSTFVLGEEPFSYGYGGTGKKSNVRFSDYGVQFGQGDTVTAFLDKLVRGKLPPSSKDKCEVIMMVGLPGAGKTYLAQSIMDKSPEKQYNLLGTNLILDKMKTNVYPSAQRRKMRPFEGFRRKAIVVVPTDDVFRQRINKREKEEGKEVPESAINEMKANFSIPVPYSQDRSSPFDQVEFSELEYEDAKRLVDQYVDEASRNKTSPEKRHCDENRSNSFDRRDNNRYDRNSDDYDRPDYNRDGYNRDQSNDRFGGRNGPRGRMPYSQNGGRGHPTRGRGQPGGNRGQPGGPRGFRPQFNNGPRMMMRGGGGPERGDRFGNRGQYQRPRGGPGQYGGSFRHGGPGHGHNMGSQMRMGGPNMQGNIPSGQVGGMSYNSPQGGGRGGYNNKPRDYSDGNNEHKRGYPTDGGFAYEAEPAKQYGGPPQPSHGYGMYDNQGQPPVDKRPRMSNPYEQDYYGRGPQGDASGMSNQGRQYSRFDKSDSERKGGEGQAQSYGNPPKPTRFDRSSQQAPQAPGYNYSSQQGYYGYSSGPPPAPGAPAPGSQPVYPTGHEPPSAAQTDPAALAVAAYASYYASVGVPGAQAGKAAAGTSNTSTGLEAAVNAAQQFNASWQQKQQVNQYGNYNYGSSTSAAAPTQPQQQNPSASSYYGRQ